MKKKVFLTLTFLVLAALVFGACSASKYARHHRNYEAQHVRHYGIEYRDENGHIVRNAPYQTRGCRSNYASKRASRYGAHHNAEYHHNAEHHGVTTRGHHQAYKVTGPNYRYKTLTPQADRRVPNPFHRQDFYANRGQCDSYYYKNCEHAKDNVRNRLHKFGEDTQHNLHNFRDDAKRNVKHGTETVGDNLHNFGEDTKQNVKRGVDGVKRGFHIASVVYDTEKNNNDTGEKQEAVRPNQNAGNGISQIMGGSLAAASFLMHDNGSSCNGVSLPVIMYHSILKSRSGKYIVSPAVLEADMQYLINQGYTTVFTQEVIDYVKGQGKLPDKPIIITFDDGYYNNMIYVLPIFQKLGIKGVINIVGHYADKAVAEGDNNANYSHLSWEQMRELSKSGIFEIGNHTYDMHNHGKRVGVTKKRGESLDDYRRALDADIGKLQCELTSKSGITPNIFAYPFGKYSKETPNILKDMGFEAVFTCNEGINVIRRGDSEALMSLKRYNRPAGIKTEKFFERIIA